MSYIEKVLERIKPILKELEQIHRVSIKVSIDRDSDIIRIYGEGTDYIKRASSGLSELLELSYTTAEHHPYWLLLYHATEICKMTLDKWEAELSDDQLSEMSWRCDEIRMVLEKLETRG